MCWSASESFSSDLTCTYGNIHHRNSHTPTSFSTFADLQVTSSIALAPVVGRLMGNWIPRSSFYSNFRKKDKSSAHTCLCDLLSICAVQANSDLICTPHKMHDIRPSWLYLTWGWSIVRWACGFVTLINWRISDLGMILTSFDLLLFIEERESCSYV